MEWQFSVSLQSCRTYVNVSHPGEHERRHGGFGVVASKQRTYPISIICSDCKTMPSAFMCLCLTVTVVPVMFASLESSPVTSPCPRHHIRKAPVVSRLSKIPPCIVAEPGVPRRCCCKLQRVSVSIRSTNQPMRTTWCRTTRTSNYNPSSRNGREAAG